MICNMHLYIISVNIETRINTLSTQTLTAPLVPGGIAWPYGYLPGHTVYIVLDYDYCILYFATRKWPLALCCLIINEMK